MGAAWNHNTHYHGLLLSLLPCGGAAALDIGCGDGTFAAALACQYERVLAIDPDPAQVTATSQRCSHLPQVFVQRADFLTAQLPSGEFDAITAIAAFHHMPFDEAAREVGRVLKPGGRLVVLGVWTDSTRRDLALNLASSALNGWLRLRRGPDVMDAPATFERTSWRTVRLAAHEHLPGARLRRHLLWRYTLVWDKASSESWGSGCTRDLSNGHEERIASFDGEGVVTPDRPLAADGFPYRAGLFPRKRQRVCWAMTMTT